jgi:large subunit ribosomal protein L13
MKTYQPKQKDVKRVWHLIDAKGKILGRMSTQIAIFLTGKHKPSYSKHMDIGDWVVVINAKDIMVTGKKAQQKVYYKHSGYPGGFKEVKYSKLIAENPRKVIEIAVGGMLPDNRLKDKRLRRLKVYSGEIHPYVDKFSDSKMKVNEK